MPQGLDPEALVEGEPRPARPVDGHPHVLVEALRPLRRVLGPLAVLPALVIGSVTPDLPYFMPTGLHRADTHSLAALLWFCLPAGLALFFLFDRLLKDPLTFLLPAPVRARVAHRPPRAISPHLLLGVCLSTLAGALTHIVWDSFTHADGAVVVARPELRVLVAEWWGYKLFRFKVLQHASTVVGATLLGYWLVQWIRREPISDRASLNPPFAESVRTLLPLTSVAIGAAVGIFRASERLGGESFERTVRVGAFFVVTSTFSAWAVAVGIFAFAWWFRSVRRTSAA
jgi:hypothetical protein